MGSTTYILRELPQKRFGIYPLYNAEQRTGDEHSIIVSSTDSIRAGDAIDKLINDGDWHVELHQFNDGMHMVVSSYPDYLADRAELFKFYDDLNFGLVD